MKENYLESVKEEFLHFKVIAERAMMQCPDRKLFVQSNEESNSIATIVKHISGNMISRWTDFLTSDGEKEWRNRDGEFENDIQTRKELLKCWDKGWDRFLLTLNSLTGDDLDKIILIRKEKLTVAEAINRQLAHYCYHIGQIVLLAKMHSTDWKSLTIPRKK